MMFMSLPQPSDGFEWTQEPWGPALRCRPLSGVAPHLFTTASLRLVDDEREWTALADRMGVERRRLRLIRQVHGIAVAVVRSGGPADVERPEADAIVSDDPASAVAVRVADCAPILLADRRLGVAGAVHAGWRGTMQRAAVAAVQAMVRTFGSDPDHLVAAIGPCLGPCCGEVGPEVLAGFRGAGHSAGDMARWFRAGAADRSYLDLWRANRDQLAAAGIPADQIFVAALCTKSHPRLLHSYRADGRNAGRMAGIIRAGLEG
jgi:YfiH family protein